MYKLKQNILAPLLSLGVALVSFVAMIWVNGNFAPSVAAGISLAVGVAVFCSILVGRGRRPEHSQPHDVG